jgi:hypothetical protein
VIAMSPLADAIYAILRTRVPAPRPELTYAALCDLLGDAFVDVRPTSHRLWAALSEVVHTCRRNDLPSLPGIVVSHKTGAPGVAYYADAHPAESSDPVIALLAWAVEVHAVRKTTYPLQLPPFSIRHRPRLPHPPAVPTTVPAPKTTC